ncbi:unnamed protein product [Adineta steineri]|uniref:Uncharacterized protein n=1 Tax=Adineta steineri TaxID=433720 RepID=A0A818I5V8_9BILA|nr:unnamed protein product [Adineta steineri]CAF3515221.1 unnamed protein product [Adineta steineri]
MAMANNKTHNEEFKQRINEQNHSLMKQINQWERNSIEIIQQKAQKCREILIKSSETLIYDMEKKLNGLSEQIKQIHRENEIDLNYLKNQLANIVEELNNPPNISPQQNSQPIIDETSIISLKKSKLNKWKQNAVTVAGGNREEQELNELSYLHGIFIDEKKNIFIADSTNHRIVEWKYDAEEGQIIAGRNGKGDRMDQLNYPTDVIVDQQNHSIIIADSLNRRVIQWLNQKQQILIHNIDCYGLAMDKQGYLYVSDCMKNEVRRWKMGEYNEGIIVAGSNEKGDQLNQLHYPTFIFVDKDQSVYVSDCFNNRVMKWKKDANEGTIVAGGNGCGENLNQLAFPQGVIVDDLGQIYVADWRNHRIMCWCEGRKEGEVVVGGHRKGDQSNQLNGPHGLSFDDERNLYVVDNRNHRIQKFEVDL